MEVKVINNKRVLYQGYIYSLIAPGFNGYFQILKNHAPFISILKNGFLKLLINNMNENKKIKIKEEGLLQVKKNKVIVIL
ncbi:FoF1 ATP synthase subunit delta/epsilon [Blattabacterium cuenoti]|uniref:FoF1 ATP synthase subunit delta/epsilon n=1 Tax=Blattabacterium cuenoti TaxID=1653831 RepID=UPI00163C2377|nr:F0F1 ATP synthase subunit epsilon [Blattabacterium cuenoti]